MIRVNLLWARKEKKKGGARKELIVLGVSVGLLAVVLGAVHYKMSSDRSELMTRIANKRNQIARYKALTSEVAKAKETQKSLQEKLDVINTLRKEKSSPARILDELSVYKPEKLHLETVKKEGLKLGIDGLALDDETIANFMTNLRKSKLFKNIDLIVSEQIELSKIKVKRFMLSCEISPL